MFYNIFSNVKIKKTFGGYQKMSYFCGRKSQDSVHIIYFTILAQRKAGMNT